MMSRNFVVTVANMPWTLEDMTPEQLQQWIASRKEAGRSINIETCEIGRWAAYDCDPYGINPDLPEEMQQVGTNRFVRSSESQGWVWEGDLPKAVAEAMYDRLHREWEEYVHTHPDDPYTRANRQPAAPSFTVTTKFLLISFTPVLSGCRSHLAPKVS